MIVYEALGDLLVSQARDRRPPTTAFQHYLASVRIESHQSATEKPAAPLIA